MAGLLWAVASNLWYKFQQMTVQSQDVNRMDAVTTNV